MLLGGFLLLLHLLLGYTGLASSNLQCLACYKAIK
jgi:hypothetical protein